MADVESMQLSVKTRRDQLQDVVNACTWEATRPPFYQQWLDEYAKATAYINLEPSFWSSANQVAQGQQLLDELNIWATNIAAQPECKGVVMPPAPVQPPAPTPGGSGGGGFFGGLSNLFNNVTGMELLLGAVALYYLSEKRGR